MQPEAGESASSITKRSDDSAWEKIETLLKQGCTLHRPKNLQTYYPHDGRDYRGGTGGISRARVRWLEDAGVLISVGVDRYAIALASGATA